MLILRPFELRYSSTLISWIPDERSLMLFAGPIWTFPLTEQQILDDHQRRNIQAFVALHNDTNDIIGYGEIHPSVEYFKLARIIIGRTQYRGHGYGRQLVQLLLDYGHQELKYAQCRLNVFIENTPALSLYQRLGFRKINSAPIYRQCMHEQWEIAEMQYDF